jgi:hypothetical protein
MRAPAAMAVALTVAVAGCGSNSAVAHTQTVTMTVTKSVTAEPPPAPVPSLPPLVLTHWGGEGSYTYAVGDADRDGLVAIPPGRYRTATTGRTGAGLWRRCSDLQCGVGHENNVIAADALFAPGTSVVDVLPTDVAVFMLNVSFTRV